MGNLLISDRVSANYVLYRHSQLTNQKSCLIKLHNLTSWVSLSHAHSHGFVYVMKIFVYLAQFVATVIIGCHVIKLCYTCKRTVMYYLRIAE